MSRELGEVWMRGQLLAVVAQAWWRLDDPDRAEAAAQESARLINQIDDRRSLVALVAGMATMAVSRGCLERAAVLLGCVYQLLESIANPLLAVQRERHRATEETAVRALGEKAFAAAVKRARSMTVDEAVAYAVEDREQAKPAPAARSTPAVRR